MSVWLIFLYLAAVTEVWGPMALDLTECSVFASEQTRSLRSSIADPNIGVKVDADGDYVTDPGDVLYGCVSADQKHGSPRDAGTE